MVNGIYGSLRILRHLSCSLRLQINLSQPGIGTRLIHCYILKENLNLRFRSCNNSLNVRERQSDNAFVLFLDVATKWTIFLNFLFALCK